MTNTGALTELVERTVEGLGYEFVELERLARGLVRVTIDTTAEGGITLDDVAPLMETGVTGIAVSGAIIHAADPIEATRRFIEAINIY